jgi:hypothetical protein
VKAPELAAGAAVVSSASALLSLGVTAFTLWRRGPKLEVGAHFAKPGPVGTSIPDPQGALLVVPVFNRRGSDSQLRPSG